MDAQVDAAITAGITRLGGLPQYVAKMKADADAALNLPQTTRDQVDHKIQMIVATSVFIKRLLGRSDVTEEQKTELVGKHTALVSAVGRKDEVQGGRRRKMSRKYCKKTTCKKMGFSQKASCRPYKNCFTRRSSKSSKGY